MRILISGYYGFGNTGDEAVLAVIVRGLRERLPDADLCVLSGNPRATEADFQVEAVDRWRSSVVWRELREADFLIQGGGGLLQDTTSSRSPLYYLALLHAARLTRTPYMIFAQGIGPLQSAFLQGLTCRNLRRARAITVRDQASADLLAQWGLERPEVEVTADPGLLLEPAPPERTGQLLASLDLSPGQPYLAVALRRWPGLKTFLPYLVDLLRHREEALLLLPFQFQADLPLALQLSGALPARVHLPQEAMTPSECVSLIKEARAVVAMRLHAMIFAASQGTPAVGLAYDPKVDAFCARSGQRLLHLEEVTTQRLEETLAEAVAEAEADAANQRIGPLKAAAERNFEALQTVLPHAPRY